jgi:ribonuclease J
VEESLDAILAEAPGRVIVATFASLLSRVQQVINVAARRGRKVVVEGRSMEDNVAMGRELGYLQVPQGVLISRREASRLDPKELVIVATGSQGEPRATLARLAMGTHRDLSIRTDDTVILSAQMIPGNEEDIIRIINQLVDQGADVLYDKVAPVHVSGHGSAEDLKLLMRLFRPKYLMPIHGEARHLHQHARLAHQLGIDREHTPILKNGDILELDEESIEIVDHVEQDTVFVDGSVVGDVGPVVLRDREILARDGFVVAVLARDPANNTIFDAQIISRGFVYLRESEELIQRIQEEALAVAKSATARTLTDRVQRALARLLRRETGREPMVIVAVAG